MADTYFSKFNQIQYGNTTAIDITERSVVLNSVDVNPYLYYPQDITQGVRADRVSYSAYSDPYRSWIIYLTNNIVDPYYDWYLDQNQLTEFIKNKYGTVEKAMSKVAFYRNNWVEQNPISVSMYDALSADQKKYWTPTYNNYGKISSYERRRDDITSSTNFVLQYGISGTHNFVKDEVLTIKLTPQSSGKAQVVQANDTCLVAQHIFDDAFPHDSITITANSYVYGTESGSNVAVTSCTFLSNNINSDELAYWAPVYYFDIEQEKNEGNKTVKLLRPEVVPDFVNNFKNLMS